MIPTKADTKRQINMRIRRTPPRESAGFNHYPQLTGVDNMDISVNDPQAAGLLSNFPPLQLLRQCVESKTLRTSSRLQGPKRDTVFCNCGSRFVRTTISLMQCYPVGRHLETLRPFPKVADYFPRLLDWTRLALIRIHPYTLDHWGPNGCYVQPI